MTVTAIFYVGDAIEVMSKLPEKSVDLILTSPPFLALRSYLPSDHPDKALEIGSEPTPGEYVDRLIDVVEACDRVLAPHGSMCIELGDTYSGSGGGGGDYLEGGWREGQAQFAGSAASMRESNAAHWRQKNSNVSAWPLSKSLSLIPELFRLTLVYGTNPLTGRQTERWRLRNVVRWVRPNPPVGALGDKFRPATSELMVFCKSAKRYFDLDSVREPYKAPDQLGKSMGYQKGADPTTNWLDGRDPSDVREDRGGAPRLDWWKDSGATNLSEISTSDLADELARRGWKDVRADISIGEVLNVPLLDGEEPTVYGPKQPRKDWGIRQKGPAWVANPKRGDYQQGIGEWSKGSNPLGAPPLDWWNIPPGGYEGAHYACVDDETEALTRGGWKSHKELMDGDEIAAYDLPTDRILWQSAKFVRYDVEGEELVCIEKEQTSQRLTVDHRMLIKSRKRDPFVKLAGEVSSGYDLPLSAPWGESGSINGPGTVHAAIFGWFITEGSARPLSRQAYIYQSQTANSAKVDEIRQLLEWSGVPFDERIRDRSNEFPGKGIQVVFVLHDSPLTRWLREHHKHLPTEYIYEWPEKDAQALFDAMVDGDGHRRADGRISFVQKDKALADAFQCLAIRLGYRAIVKHRGDSDVYTVYCSVNRWVTLRGPDGKRAAIPRETYTGTVWCPQVFSTFWLARRNGKPFITGNTFPPELCIKPIKAMCPEKVCRVCGEPSRRIVESVRPQPVSNGAYQEGRLRAGGDFPSSVLTEYTTTGFSDCGHDDWRPGVVLDPFVGSGTTLMVATGHGRDAIGIDLDARNFDMALERVGPFILERASRCSSPLRSGESE